MISMHFHVCSTREQLTLLEMITFRDVLIAMRSSELKPGGNTRRLSEKKEINVFPLIMLFTDVLTEMVICIRVTPEVLSLEPSF